MVKKTSNPKERLLLLKEWLQENDPTCKNNESKIERRLGLGTGYFATTGSHKQVSI